MWSLGIILYVLLSGEAPFDVSMGIEVVENACISFQSNTWVGISDPVKDLILKLLTKDPKDRLNIAHACRHAWILEDDGDTHTFPLDDPILSALHVSRDVESKEGSTSVKVQQSSIPSIAQLDHPSTCRTRTSLSSQHDPLQTSSSIQSISKIKRARTRSVDTDDSIDHTTTLSPNQAANFPSPFCSSSLPTGTHDVDATEDPLQRLRRRGETSLFSCVRKLSKAKGPNT